MPGDVSPKPPLLSASWAAASAVQAGFRTARTGGDARSTVFSFDATGSQCREGRITRWQWDFGDGTSANGPKVTHAYAKQGSYRVALRLVTDRNEGAKTERLIRVDPPWLNHARHHGGIWIEAETLRAEGDGKSRTMAGRVNASGKIVTYWDKDIGHWLEWTIPVAKTGAYAVALRYASGTKLAVRDCRIDGTAPGAEWNGLRFEGTGGYSSQADNWRWCLLRDRAGRPLRHALAAGDRAPPPRQSRRAAWPSTPSSSFPWSTCQSRCNGAGRGALRPVPQAHRGNRLIGQKE